MGLKVELDDLLLRKIDDHFLWVAYSEKKPVGRRVPFDRNRYTKYAAHQIPGGMMSHLASQLKNLGLEHRLPEVLEEAGRVRQEIGYPVMVTPFSQIVGVQAVFNVIQKDRYRTTPSDLSLYARGYYGEMAAPIDANVLDRILEGADVKALDRCLRGLFRNPWTRRPVAGTSWGRLCSDEHLLAGPVLQQTDTGKFFRIGSPLMWLRQRRRSWLHSGAAETSGYSESLHSERSVETETGILTGVQEKYFAPIKSVHSLFVLFLKTDGRVSSRTANRSSQTVHGGSAMEQKKNPGPDTLMSKGYSWYVFGLLFFLYMFDYVDRMVVVSLFPYLIHEWGLSDTQCGLLVSTVYWSIVILSFPVSVRH